MNLHTAIDESVEHKYVKIYAQNTSGNRAKNSLLFLSSSLGSQI